MKREKHEEETKIKRACKTRKREREREFEQKTRGMVEGERSGCEWHTVLILKKGDDASSVPETESGCAR